ncbi:MAG: hypothetical protein L0210_13610 [Rhodospirillales bacterium]|nr:hypothetical protein [Rhodospirillales bacterium]
MRWGLVAFAAVLIASALAVPLRPEAALIFPPFTEDGYYSLTIARAIAAGHGPALEGSGPTNGFQPLVTLLQAGAFLATGGAELPALRIVAWFGWCTFVGAALLLGRVAAEAAEGNAAERSRRGLLAAVLALAALPLWLDHFNGLETGLLLLLLTLLWRLWQLGLPRRWPGLVLCGVLLGVLVLTRIDAVFLVLALAGMEAVAARRSGWGQALARAATLGGLAFLVSAPWWAFNILLFGSPMPVSGQAQQLWALDPYRWRWIAWSLGQALAPWLSPTLKFDDRWSWLPFAGALALVIAAAPLARRLRPLAGTGFHEFGSRPRRLPSRESGTNSKSCIHVAGPRLWRGSATLGTSASDRFAAALGLAIVALTLWYGFSSIAFWFYARYLAPASLLGVVLAATLLARVPVRRASLLVLALPLLATPVLMGSRAAWQGSTTHFGTIMFWDQLELVRRLVPPEDWVAAGQSGTLGFFRPRVLNMDGKVNPEARAYAGRGTEYLKAKGVRWFVDWEWYVHRALGPEPERQGWVKIGERRKFLLYRLEEGATGSAAP